jgi:glycoprotein endo-alpha-1,2-mannosidase
MIMHINKISSILLNLTLIVTLFLFADKAFSQKAVRFESPGDYIEVPHSASLSPAEFTIEFWLKVHGLGDPNEAGGEQTILDKRGNNTGYNLRLAGTGFPIPVFAFVLPGSVRPNNDINPNSWYHIAVTQDQDSLRIYFNGKLEGETANSYASATTAPLRIGDFLGYPGRYLGLRGEIDELRIWNTARNQDEVQAAMYEKLTGSESGLAGYWDFDSQSGITITDLSSNGNDGTLHGNANLVVSEAPIGFVPPAQPVGLRAYGGAQAIDLAWKPGGNGISGYRIYRGDSLYFQTDANSLLATVSAPDSTYTDQDVSAGRDYIYLLHALDDELHVSQPGNATLSRTVSAQSQYFTGVYYYPWYDPILKHKWVGQFSRDFLVPQQPPMLDHYSSKDPQVILQHLNWMQTYGVDFMVSSWWGQNSWEDVTLRDFILPEIINTPVRFTIYYESKILDSGPDGINIDAAKEEQLVSDFNYIAETYFDHPNLLKVNGKPVVFIYLSRIYSGNYEQAFSRVRSELQSAGYELFLIGDEVGWGTPSASHMRFLDAVSPYIMVGNSKYRDYALDRDFLADISVKVREWEEFAHAEGIYVIPNVHPGFNNVSVSGSGFVVPRQIQAGAESTSLLEEYTKVMLPFVDPLLKMIMITSWNEWHEDSQIEPTIVTPATSIDNSASGDFYTHGYSYEGYGLKALEVIRSLLPGELPPLSVDELPMDAPSDFTLFQNNPNPIHQLTTISFYLPESSTVNLSIYNAAGQLIETLVNTQKEHGIHEENWNASGVGSGVYFYALSAGKYFAVQKLVVL